MKLTMTGLDHKRANLETREKFAITKEKAKKILVSLKDADGAGGGVIISTCNRTELYASVPEGILFEPSRFLCEKLAVDFAEYRQFFTERTDERAVEHLCRVASGLDSQIIGDDQIITQVREALEMSRNQKATDSYIETMFNLAGKAAKNIKTKVILKTLGVESIPIEAVNKLKTLTGLHGRSIVVIGNGQIGRLVSELLIGEGASVTVTLREYKKGAVRVPDRADTICYSKRYVAIGQADIVVSATTSPHFTVHHDEFFKLKRHPEIIVDLAVPRDVDPEIQGIPGTTLLTIDDISSEGRSLSPESNQLIDGIIEDCISKYYQWLSFKEGVRQEPIGGVA